MLAIDLLLNHSKISLRITKQLLDATVYVLGAATKLCCIELLNTAIMEIDECIIEEPVGPVEPVEIELHPIEATYVNLPRPMPTYVSMRQLTSTYVNVHQLNPPTSITGPTSAQPSLNLGPSNEEPNASGSGTDDEIQVETEISDPRNTNIKKKIIKKILPKRTFWYWCRSSSVACALSASTLTHTKPKATM
jgi:hypothetical protein